MRSFSDNPGSFVGSNGSGLTACLPRKASPPIGAPPTLPFGCAIAAPPMSMLPTSTSRRVIMIYAPDSRLKDSATSCKICSDAKHPSPPERVHGGDGLCNDRTSPDQILAAQPTHLRRTSGCRRQTSRRRVRLLATKKGVSQKAREG